MGVDGMVSYKCRPVLNFAMYCIIYMVGCQGSLA